MRPKRHLSPMVVLMHLGLRGEPATVYSDRTMSFANPKNVFGPILRQLREQKGLSPIQLAERCAQTCFDCSEERIIRIENQAEPIKDYELLIFERISGLPKSPSSSLKSSKHGLGKRNVEAALIAGVQPSRQSLEQVWCVWVDSGRKQVAILYLENAH